MERFTYRSARSGSLLAGLVIVIVVETVVLHIWLVGRLPLLVWVLTASSLGVLAWLVADYRAAGMGAVRLGPEVLELHIGRRYDIRLARTDVSAALRPDWRDVPEAGTAAAARYLNLTKPAEPNVILTLHASTAIRLPGGFTRSVQRLGLHLDEPAAFLAALNDAGMPAERAEA